MALYFTVPSEKRHDTAYWVALEPDNDQCDCDDFRIHAKRHLHYRCKHISICQWLNRTHGGKSIIAYEPSIDLKKPAKLNRQVWFCKEAVEAVWMDRRAFLRKIGQYTYSPELWQLDEEDAIKAEQGEF